MERMVFDHQNLSTNAGSRWLNGSFVRVSNDRMVSKALEVEFDGEGVSGDSLDSHFARQISSLCLESTRMDIKTHRPLGVNMISVLDGW